MLRSATLVALTCLAQPATAEDLNLASQMGGLTTTRLSTLPVNPDGPVSRECGVVLATPATSPGKKIARLGWGVTAEVAQNGLEFISFVGRASPGTSGTCLLEDGNLAILRAGQIVGLVYAGAGANRDIGMVETMDQGLRLWDGDFIRRPLADLRLLGADIVVVTYPASQDVFCQGAISIPNLYGLPIGLARRFLLEGGWQPAPGQNDLPNWMTYDLPEAQGCSGTGFNPCGFDYQWPTGAILSVTTTGEAEPGTSPLVARYGVTCPPN